MKYLDLLKAKNGQKPLPYPLTKLTKGASVSFVSDPGDRISEKTRADPLLLVECWTPSGTRMMVLADNPDHAEQIRRWNPRPRGVQGC